MNVDDTAGQARKGLLDSVKGKAKEVAGAVIGNDSLTTEGQLQQRQAQDRQEANTTNAVADAQAQQAAEELTATRQDGAQARAEVAQEAAATKETLARQQDAQHQVAEQAQQREATVGNAEAKAEADTEVRRAASAAQADTASAAQEAAQATAAHDRSVREADDAEAEAARARATATKLSGDAEPS